MSDWRREIRTRLANARLDPAYEADIVEELAQHLDDQFADLTARGMSSDDARATLLTQLDDPASRFPHDILECRRAVRIRDSTPIGGRPTATNFLASIWHDMKYGARALRRTPGFTAVIVLSLGIVIGANTAIFGLMHSVLLRRLPLPHPEQLVALRPMNGGYRASLTYDDYKTLKQAPGFPRTEAYVPLGATVSVQDDHADLWVELVSGGYFDLIGVPPLLGRTISNADDATSAPVVVVSEDYWRQHLGGDRAALGKPLTINDVSFTLVGVMPHTYRGIYFGHAFSIAIPLTSGFLTDDRVRNFNVSLLARVPNGASDRAMAARVNAAFLHCCSSHAPIGRQSAIADPRPRPIPEDGPVSANGGWHDPTDATPHVQILDASRGITWSVDFRGQYKRVLFALMAGVALLLVIACANVGTLLLTRAAARTREFAVRLSLGASRGRLMRQLLTESLEVAIAGTMLGLVLSWAGTSLILHNLPGNALQLGDVIAWRASPTILAFTTVLAAMCAVIAGIWPARHGARVDILAPLTGADRANARARGWPVDAGLAVAQISLALVLVATATLFVATLRNLERADGGYHSRNVLLARVESRNTRFEHTGLGAVVPRIVEDLRRLPGADAVSASLAAPVISDFWAMQHVEIPERAPIPGDETPLANAVTAGYFAATGIGLQAGREFDDHDVAGGEPVAVVSEAFARRYFADRSPIGVSLTVQFRTSQRLRIVGIARDAQYRDLHGQPSEMWYMPWAQWNALSWAPSYVAIAVRTERDPVSLAPAVRSAINRLAPGVRIRRITSVGELLDDALAKERLAAGLAALFGVVALGLALLGVYGVVAYSVTRRTQEIGVRMALGAAPRDAVWLVMRQTVTMAIVGVSIGIPLAYAAGLGIASQLFGVGAADPRVLLGAAIVLGVAGAAAGLIPGRRAARVDPIIALRSE
ncbi:MAG TPA: ABC transporter permease [Gemmatimonadaceae bacterium]|nr:ABC transporter permease [Gemmatimonadaceae bacterium]